MIRARVVVEGDVQDFVSEVRAASAGADKAMKKDLDKIAKSIQQPLLRDLQALTPPPAVRPIQWTSPKQRRYVMWKLAQEGRLGGDKPYPPYRRAKGKKSVMGMWRVRQYISKNGNLITATNPWEKYKYVVEDPAHVNVWQRFHRRTGWPSAGEIDAVFAAWSDVAQQRIGESWFQYWDRVMK